MTASFVAALRRSVPSKRDFGHLTTALRFELLAAAITIPASIILNRSLGPRDRGSLALVLLIPTYAFVVGSCQWDRLSKAAVAQREISIGSAWAQTGRLTRRLPWLVVPIAMLAAWFMPGLSVNERFASTAFCAAMPLAFLSGSLAALVLVAGSTQWYGRCRVASQLAYFAGVVVFAVWLKLGVAGALLAQAMSFVLMWVVAALAARRLGFATTGSDRLPSRVLALGALPYALETASPRIEVGVYSFAGGHVLLGAMSAFAGMLQPIGLLSASLINAATASIDWRDRHQVRAHLLRSLAVLAVLGAGILVVCNWGGERLVAFVLE